MMMTGGEYLFRHLRERELVEAMRLGGRVAGKWRRLQQRLASFYMEFLAVAGSWPTVVQIHYVLPPLFFLFRYPAGFALLF